MSRNLVVLYISTITILLVLTLFLGCYALILSLNYSFHNASLTRLRELALTREEAIEISRNSPAVQACLNRGEIAWLFQAVYWNSTYVMLLREYPTMRNRLPTNNGVWEVTYFISRVVSGFPPWEYIGIIVHYIDEMTGEILYERNVQFG